MYTSSPVRECQVREECEWGSASDILLENGLVVLTG